MRRNLLVILACALIALCVISCDNHTHSYSDDWSYDETYHWHAATCEHTDVVKDKAEHVWDEGKITTPATAEEAGVKTYTCTICKEGTKTENISKCETHQFGDWKDGGNGKHSRECSVCGLKEEGDHTFGDWTVDGTNEKSTCTVCNYEATREISKWDGTSADISWYEADKTKKEYTLTSAAQLAGLAQLVNGGTDETKLGNGVPFEGVTIKLACNINLGDQQWTPIGLYHDKEDTSGFTKKPFSGTFDGQGHTIIGLKIDLGESTKSAYRGLFGYVCEGTVKDFTLNGTVTATDSAAVVGSLSGGTISGVTSNVTVTSKNATTTDGNKPQSKAAGIVVGVIDNTNGSKIENCTNNGNITSEATNATCGVGGIVAHMRSTKSLTISGCINTGKITDNGAQDAGGIIGTIDYQNTETTITGCSNSGALTAGKNTGGNGQKGYAGGIVGEIYGSGKLTISSCTAGEGLALVGNKSSSATVTTDDTTEVAE